MFRKQTEVLLWLFHCLLGKKLLGASPGDPEVLRPCDRSVPEQTPLPSPTFPP